MHNSQEVLPYIFVALYLIYQWAVTPCIDASVSIYPQSKTLLLLESFNSQE